MTRCFCRLRIAKISALLRVHDQLVQATALADCQVAENWLLGKSSEKIERGNEQLQLALEDLACGCWRKDDGLIYEGIDEPSPDTAMRPLAPSATCLRCDPARNAANWTPAPAARTWRRFYVWLGEDVSELPWRWIAAQIEGHLFPAGLSRSDVPKGQIARIKKSCSRCEKMACRKPATEPRRFTGSMQGQTCLAIF